MVPCLGIEGPALEPAGMPDLRRVLRNVLEPHVPALLRFTHRVAPVSGVDGVKYSLIELDQEVQTLKNRVAGASLDYDAIEAAVAELGGSVTAVDQVGCGDAVVAEPRTLQDD